MRKAVSTFSLAILFAAVGCTTNYNPGDGQPANAPAMVPSSTPGASSGTTNTPPMASSFATPMTPSERAAARVDAVAVLAADQAYRGRVLGPANPAAVPSGPTASPMIAEPLNPAQIANPGVSTVNNTISSPGTPAITGGDAGGGVSAAGVSSAAAVIAAPATVGSTSGVATTAAPATVAAQSAIAAPVTTTTNGTTSALVNTTGINANAAITGVRSQGAIPASSATFPITGTLSQTANSAMTATVPIASPTLATTTATTTAPRTTSAITTTTSGTTGALKLSAAKSPTATGQLRNPVQIVTGTNGSITLTNVQSTSKQ